MKIGVFDPVFGDLALEPMLDRVAGYDHVLSIAHEDGPRSVHEGSERAVATLRASVMRERPANAWSE